MKQRQSKLDPYAEQLDQWFSAVEAGGENLSLQDARTRLAKVGCEVSLGRLAEWWQQRSQSRLQDQLLARIATGARQVKAVEAQFAKDAPPELETLIKLLRVLIMQLSTQANVAPEMIELVVASMKPVLEFAKIQQKDKEQKIDEKKLELMQFDAAKAAMAELPALRNIAGDNALNEDGKIQAALKVLFGDAVK